MPERTEADRALKFMELVMELHNREINGKLPNGFIPPMLLAMSVDKAKDTLYPDTIPTEQPQHQEPPQRSRVEREFPSSSPEGKQGDAKSKAESAETIEVEVPINISPERGND